jgi:uncharacterized metal-binding protein
MPSELEKYPNCAKCKILACKSGHKNIIPENCPMILENELLEKTRKEYLDEELKNIACSAARVEAEGYCHWTRIEEIIAFARKSSFKRIGLAYCIGLRREAARFSEIMTQCGFEMISVVCKTGSIPKETLGLTEDEKVNPGHFEAICNPVAQAELLNKAKTDLNVLLGLCVGHDTIFIRYAKSPLTVLAVKDRVLAHNPLGAIYARHYFDRRFR